MTTTSPPSAPILDDVAAALAVCVVDEPPREALPRALGWALQVWGHGVDDAPLAAIHDLGFLLLRGRAVRLCGGRERFDLPLEVPIDDDDAVDVRVAVRRERLVWEERVVAASLRDPTIMQAVIVIAGAPADRTDELLVHALMCLLPRLVTATMELPRGSPASLRPLLDAPAQLWAASERERIGGSG